MNQKIKGDEDPNLASERSGLAKNQSVSVAPSLMQKILVCDLAGSGFQILWTLDNQTWIRVVRQRMLNAAERDGYLARFQREQPQAEVRHIEDFFCRIPADWRVLGARVI